jgi:glycerol-3-phosphate dehydrogenase
MNVEKKEFVGVIGAGSFGLTIANLLSHNVQVLLFARRPEVVAQINEHHFFDNVVISHIITRKWSSLHCLQHLLSMKRD